jgi:hypothetical protein
MRPILTALENGPVLERMGHDESGGGVLGFGLLM